MNSTAAPPCSVTILRTVGTARATKHWRWNAVKNEWSKKSYNAGAMFEPATRPVRNLVELVAVLDAVRRDPRAFVVRGDLTPGVLDAMATNPGHKIRRRKLKKGDYTPELIEASRQWLMIDIDNYTLPSWADLADDPEAAVDHAIHELLPPAFHDVECWWQLSASAGFAAGVLKVHLFFWLTEPAENEHIKRVLK